MNILHTFSRLQAGAYSPPPASPAEILTENSRSEFEEVAKPITQKLSTVSNDLQQSGMEKMVIFYKFVKNWPFFGEWGNLATTLGKLDSTQSVAASTSGFVVSYNLRNYVARHVIYTAVL